MIENFSKENLLSICKNLKLGRRFEEKVIELGDLNKIRCLIHPFIRMEAVGVGVCLALSEKDIIVPTF